ncbi:hypothetical protein Vafri_2059, partial [Volvox africanus]
KPPAGPPRGRGAKRRASGTPSEVSPTGGAGAARVPPLGKRSRHGSREASPVPQNPDESHRQPQQQQQQQLCGELAYDLQCRALQQQQQQLQQEQQLLVQLQQQGLIGSPSAVPQSVPANAPKGRGRGRPPASGRGRAALTMAAAVDLAAAGVAIAPAGPHFTAERTSPGGGTAAQVEAVAPEVGQLASPRLQWATRRRRTSASLSREGSVELLQGSGSSGQPPPPPPPQPLPQPQHLPALSLQGPSPLHPTPSAPRPQDEPHMTLPPEISVPSPLSPLLQRHQGESERLSPHRQPALQHQSSPDLLKLQQHHLPLQRHDQVSPPPSPLQQQLQPQPQQDVQEDASAPPLDDEMQYAHYDGGDDGSHLEAFPVRRTESRPRSSTGIGSPGGTREAGAIRDVDGAVAVAEPCTLGVATTTAAAAVASLPGSFEQRDEQAPVQEDPSLQYWEEAQTSRRLAGEEDAVREPPHVPGTTSPPVGTTSATAAASRPFKRPRIVPASLATAAAAVGVGPASEPPSAVIVEGPETAAEHDKREPASATTHALPQPQPQQQVLQELNPQQQQQQLPGLVGAQLLQAEQQAQQMQASVGGAGASGSGGRGGSRRAVPKRSGKRKAAALEEHAQEPVREPGVDVKPEPPAEGLAEAREPLVRSPGPSRGRLRNGAAAASPIGGVILVGPAVEEQHTPHGAGGVRGTSAPEGRPPLARRAPTEQQLQSEQHKEEQQHRCSSCSPGKAAGAAPKRRSSTGARKPRARKARQAATAAEAEGRAAEEPDAVGPMDHDSSAAASPRPPRHAGSSPGVATGFRRRRVSSHNDAGGSQLTAAEGGGGGALAAPTASTSVVVSISRNIPERERNGLAAAVQQLGGRVAEDEEADAGGFTHLLLARNAFTTSMKVLAALAAGRPLLDAAWLNACRAAGMWLEPHSEHTAVDPRAEKQ